MHIGSPKFHVTSVVLLKNDCVLFPRVRTSEVLLLI